MDDIYKQLTYLQKQADNLIKPEVPLGLSLISETILSGSVTSVTFSGISQNFRHLELIVQGRTDNAAEADGILIRFNADTGGNYDQQRITANHTTLSGLAVRAGTSIAITSEGANSRADNFSASTVRIFGYARTNAEKWIHSHTNAFGDVSADTDLLLTFRSHRWRSTAAITSITLLPQIGTNLVSGSIFQLYGVK